MSAADVVEVVQLSDDSSDPPVAFWNWTSIDINNDSLHPPAADSNGAVPCADDSKTAVAATHHDFTFLIVAGGTVGILLTLWLVYRAYRALFLVYCSSLRRQGVEGEVAPGGGASHPASIYVIESCRDSEGVVTGAGEGVRGMAGVLARMQMYRKGESPPPPYDSPPPYHVAVNMKQIPALLVSEPVVI